MTALDFDRHPALVWMARAQFSADDQRAFVAALRAYEDAPTLAALERVMSMAPGHPDPIGRWYEGERRRVGHPVPWAPLKMKRGGQS